MRRSTLPLPFLVVALALPSVAHGQTRAELVDSARLQFDEAVALDALLAAADPAVAPLDSLWTVSVYDMAQVLLGVGREDLAGTWLRWVARHGSDWSLDRGWYTPALAQAYDRVAPDVQPAPLDDETVVTAWRWPDDFDSAAGGALRVDAEGSPVTVEVEGVGLATAGEPLALEPGTYEVVISSEDWEPTRVTREVLPGATTVLHVSLVPLLPAEVESRVASAVALLRAGAAPDLLCVDGVVREEDLVLTPGSGLGAAGTLTVETAAGRRSDLPVLAHDPATDFAVLRAPATSLALPDAPGAPGQYAWSVYHPGCGDPVSQRTRIATWPPDANGRFGLEIPLDAEAVGAPLVDRTGGVLGLVVEPRTAVRLDRANTLLRTALAELEPEGDTVPVASISSGGGLPLKWIGAGVAVAGLAAVVAGGGGGGGGDDGGGGGGGGGGTTGINVTWPGGAP